MAPSTSTGPDAGMLAICCSRRAPRRPRQAAEPPGHRVAPGDRGRADHRVLVGGATWLVTQVLDLTCRSSTAWPSGADRPTDPIAVLAILKQVGAPKSIEVKLVRACSTTAWPCGAHRPLAHRGHRHHGVFADETTSLRSCITPPAGELFLVEVGGGVLPGARARLSPRILLGSIDDTRPRCCSRRGRHRGVLHLPTSGPLAMVIAGLFIGHRGRCPR